jgi:hypothetical protein
MNSMVLGKDRQLKLQLVHSYIVYLEVGIANFMLVEYCVI